MDPDLKAYLVAMEERLNARIEKTETNFEERLNARIEKTETNLLTAFHGWARAMEIRVRGVSTMSTGYDERLALVEERLSELERRRSA